MGGRGSNNMGRVGGNTRAKRYDELPNGYRPLLDEDYTQTLPNGYYWASNGNDQVLVKNGRALDAVYAIRDSQYDWERSIKGSVNINNGFSTRKESGTTYKAALKNGGYATIVDTGSRVFVRVGQYQVDPQSSGPMARGRGFATVEDALKAVDKFMRNHPRLRLERK